MRRWVEACKDGVRAGRRWWRERSGREVRTRIQHRCNTLHLGTKAGGWIVCPDHLDADSVVYSFGVGTEISFDLAMIERFGVRVHAFDPTPRSMRWLQTQPLPPQFEFHPWGLADFDGAAEFIAPPRDDFVSFHIAEAGEIPPGEKVDAPVYRLATIMKMLHHDHVDVLKMDIEGAELGVLNDLADNLPPISQLLVEFHHRFHPHTLPDVRRALERLDECGFKMFARAPRGAEFSFIRP